MTLHHDAVVVDCHNDLIRTVASHREAGQGDYFGEYWLPQLRAGGVDVQVAAVHIEHEASAESALRRTLQLIEHIWTIADEHPDDTAVCLDGDDIDAAVGSGRIALVIAVEGSEGVGGDPVLFSSLSRVGVRMVSFAHFGRTMLADGSGEQDTGGRLTRAGVAALERVQQLGIVMDVSHLSVAGTAHVLELARGPVVASHSSARAVFDHHRNLTDEQIKAVAAGGGVVGVNFFPGFVDPQRPTIGRIVDHIEHMLGLVGADHIGLGPDFIKEYFGERYGMFPEMRIEGLLAHSTIEGLETPADLPRLTDAMSARGMSDGDIVKILGGSFLRVFREVMGKPRG